MAIRTRDTKEVINKSEGAVVSVSIFLNRMVVQKEWKATSIWGGRHAGKEVGGHHDGYLYRPHVIWEART